eukprot:COSAG02_NODE_1366_length_13032_cov_721.428207_10_plen_73_part_00
MPPRAFSPMSTRHCLGLDYAWSVTERLLLVCAVHEQVVLQSSSSASRDEVLLALRGLQQHDGTMELLNEDKA